MFYSNLIPTLCLQLFSDGGAAAANGAGNGGAAVNAEVAAPQQTGTDNRDKSSITGVKGSLSDVLYGRQPTGAPAAEEPSQSADAKEKESAEKSEPKQTSDKKAAFESLIKGEYKEQYDERVADTVQKRLKGSKEIEAKYIALTPMFELLAKKYGVDASDTAALSKAIEEDDGFWEQEAMEKGVTVEQLKFQKKIERENAELKRSMRERDARENAAKQYAAWMQQTEAAKEYYPALDLKTELENSRFVDLLRANIDVKTAYEVIHRDEIIPAAMQYAAEAAQRQIANNIAANGMRPSENGTGSRSAAQVKSDVTKLTNEDLSEIIKRVKRGDKISF